MRGHQERSDARERQPAARGPRHEGAVQDNHRSLADVAGEDGRGGGMQRERISWSAWKGSQAMNRVGSDDGELPPPEGYGTDQKSPEQDRAGRPHPRKSRDILHRQPSERPPLRPEHAVGFRAGPPGLRRASSVERGYPRTFVGEELRRPSYEYERMEPLPSTLGSGYPPFQGPLPGDRLSRDMHYPPHLPPHGLRQGPDPLMDRIPPPRGMDRRFRSPSPPPHPRDLPAWGPPGGRAPFPDRSMRYDDDPGWPPRRASPEPRGMPRGIAPRQHPMHDGLSSRLAPLFPPRSMHGPPPGRHMSPPRDFLSRPSSAPRSPRGDARLVYRGAPARSLSPRRRPPHAPSLAARDPGMGLDPMGDRMWPDSGMGPAPYVHGEEPGAYRGRRPSAPSRDGAMSGTPSGDLRDFPGRRSASSPPRRRGPPGPRDLDFGDPRGHMHYAFPDGYGPPGFAPLRHPEHRDGPGPRHALRDPGSLPPHMADAFSGPRSGPPSRGLPERAGPPQPPSRSAAPGRLPPPRGRLQAPPMGLTAAPLSSMSGPREARAGKQTGWDTPPSPEPGQVPRTLPDAPGSRSHDRRAHADPAPHSSKEARPHSTSRPDPPSAAAPSSRPSSRDRSLHTRSPDKRADALVRDRSQTAAPLAAAAAADDGRARKASRHSEVSRKPDASASRADRHADAGGSKQDARASGSNAASKTEPEPQVKADAPKQDRQGSAAQKRARSPSAANAKTEHHAQEAKRSKTQVDKPPAHRKEGGSNAEQGPQAKPTEPSRDGRPAQKPSQGDKREPPKAAVKLLDVYKDSSGVAGSSRQPSGSRTKQERPDTKTERPAEKSEGKDNGRSTLDNGTAAPRSGSNARPTSNRTAADRSDRPPASRQSTGARTEHNTRESGRDTSRTGSGGRGHAKLDHATRNDHPAKRSRSPARAAERGNSKLRSQADASSPKRARVEGSFRDREPAVRSRDSAATAHRSASDRQREIARGKRPATDAGRVERAKGDRAKDDRASSRERRGSHGEQPRANGTRSCHTDKAGRPAEQPATVSTVAKHVAAGDTASSGLIPMQISQAAAAADTGQSGELPIAQRTTEANSPSPVQDVIPLVSDRDESPMQDDTTQEAETELASAAGAEPDTAMSPTYAQLDERLERQHAVLSAAAPASTVPHTAAAASAPEPAQAALPDADGNPMSSNAIPSAAELNALNDLQAGHLADGLDVPAGGRGMGGLPAVPNGVVGTTAVPADVAPVAVSPGWDLQHAWSYQDPDGETHGLFSIKQIRGWLTSMSRKEELQQQFEDFKAAWVWNVHENVRRPLHEVVSAGGWRLPPP